MRIYYKAFDLIHDLVGKQFFLEIPEDSRKGLEGWHPDLWGTFIDRKRGILSAIQPFSLDYTIVKRERTRLRKETSGYGIVDDKFVISLLQYIDLQLNHRKLLLKEIESLTETQAKEIAALLFNLFVERDYSSYNEECVAHDLKNKNLPDGHNENSSNENKNETVSELPSKKNISYQIDENGEEETVLIKNLIEKHEFEIDWAIADYFRYESGNDPKILNLMTLDFRHRRFAKNVHQFENHVSYSDGFIKTRVHCDISFTENIYKATWTGTIDIFTTLGLNPLFEDLILTKFSSIENISSKFQNALEKLKLSHLYNKFKDIYIFELLNIPFVEGLIDKGIGTKSEINILFPHIDNYLSSRYCTISLILNKRYGQDGWLIDDVVYKQFNQFTNLLKG